MYRHVLISRGAAPKTEGISSKGDSHGNPSTPSKGDHKQEELKLTPTRSTRSATKANREEQSATVEKSTNDSSATAKAAEPCKKNECENKYGDLIEFYNLVYVKEIKDFALKFAHAQTVGLLF